MNYYSHHIGDYLSATAHLTLLEHGAYRRMIDVYYIHESALPSERKQVYRLVGARTKEEREAVDSVLAEFFTESETGWVQSRCDHEISLCNKNRENGKKGGRPSGSGNPNKTQTKPKQEPKENPNETQTESPPSPHHPITPSPELSLSEKAAAASDPAQGSSCQSPPPPSADAERAKTLAARLDKLEAARGIQRRATSPLHPDVVAWVKTGVSDPEFREAYDLAVFRRQQASDPSPINPKFLLAMIQDIVQQSKGGGTSPAVVREWHETAFGIEAKGKELGIPPPDAATGGFPAFKARVHEAVARMDRGAA